MVPNLIQKQNPKETRGRTAVLFYIRKDKTFLSDKGKFEQRPEGSKEDEHG